MAIVSGVAFWIMHHRIRRLETALLARGMAAGARAVADADARERRSRLSIV
jgi:hypothetical protein